ncbi:MAG: M48 family metalloprotease [Gammaproteobacteria bacterium]
MWLRSPTIHQKIASSNEDKPIVVSVYRQRLLMLLCLLVVLFCYSFGTNTVGAALQDLPNLGDSSSGVISPDQEYIAGRAWLRVLRGQAPIISDPLLNDYVTHLTYHLASFSELNQRKLEVVIINDSSINAFAVPGGVMGINAGLLLNAESEDEMAAVIAHEIAHLSQRHFARNLERSRRDKWKTVAALIASVALIASSSNSDTGLAALLTTQAASLQSQLSYSRQFEREADRFGMTTLAKAGKDPSAMPRFFERMHKATENYSKAPPEFLLTHPVTESRISDSYNRIIQLPLTTPEASLDFSLMKARVEASYSPDKLKNIKTFRLQAKNASTPIERAAARAFFIEVKPLQSSAQSPRTSAQKRPQPHRLHRR